MFESLGMLKTYQSSRIFAAIAEWAYRLIASHRDAAYTVTKYTFGRKIEPTQFVATQWLFLRVLALIYAVSFASFATQISGLIGAPAGGTTGTARAIFTSGARPSAVLAAALARFGLQDAVQAAG